MEDKDVQVMKLPKTQLKQIILKFPTCKITSKYLQKSEHLPVVIVDIYQFHLPILLFVSDFR